MKSIAMSMSSNAFSVLKQNKTTMGEETGKKVQGCGFGKLSTKSIKSEYALLLYMLISKMGNKCQLDKSLSLLFPPTFSVERLLCFINCDICLNILIII